MIEKKNKRISDKNIYDFRINNNIEYKRRKGDNNWRIVCKINNCFSIAKGKNRLCITHGGGYICRIKNCENTSRNSFNYCDIHKHLYLCKKKKNKIKKNQKNKIKKNPLDKYDNIGKKFVKDFFNFNILENKNIKINYNPINLSF